MIIVICIEHKSWTKWQGGWVVNEYIKNQYTIILNDRHHHCEKTFKGCSKKFHTA